MRDRGGERPEKDVRWKSGTPPAGNANFAWVQHIIRHLALAGVAGFVLASGSMSSYQSREGEIRKATIEANLVDCMIALPPQLFYGTQIPARSRRRWHGWWLNCAGRPPRRAGWMKLSGRT